MKGLMGLDKYVLVCSCFSTLQWCEFLWKNRYKILDFQIDNSGNLQFTTNCFVHIKQQPQIVIQGGKCHSVEYFFVGSA